MRPNLTIEANILPPTSEWADCLAFPAYARAHAWLTDLGYLPRGNHRSQLFTTIYRRGDDVAVIIPTTSKDIEGPVAVECDEAWDLADRLYASSSAS